jgi:uncharacterized protein YhfF
VMEPLPTAASFLPVLAALGVALPAGTLRVEGFGDSPALSEELLALIVAGRKRAGASLLWAHEADGDPVPQAGDVAIVVDHRNVPVAITRVTAVAVVAFDAVDSEFAVSEGEGDGSLAHWRRAHQAFFGRECRRIGREPRADMPVVCTSFELLQVLPR